MTDSRPNRALPPRTNPLPAASALAAFLVALAIATGIAAPARAQDIGLPVGTPAPDAVVRTLGGAPVHLARYIGHEPVLLEFWAVWCGRCRALEPSMLRLQRAYRGRVHVITIAVAVNQSPRRVATYTSRAGYAQPVLYDASGAAVDAYRAPATSYVVIIGRNGHVVYSGLGEDQKLVAAVSAALRRG